MLLIPPPSDPSGPVVPPGAPEPGLTGVLEAFSLLGTFIGQALPAQFSWLQTHAYLAGRVG